MTAAANPHPLQDPLIFLSAGEASGERYGAALMEAIRRRLADRSPRCYGPARFFGLGGAAMAAQGFRPVVRAEDVAHMGITEVVRHAPYIYGQFQRLKRAIAAERPALAVLIDFPDVNLRLAEHLHRLGYRWCTLFRRSFGRGRSGASGGCSALWTACW